MPQYCLPLSLTVVLSVVPARAADLLQIYRDALANDATYASARATRDAGIESLPQGLAQILPTVNATAFTQYNDIAIAFRGATPEQYQYRLGNSNGYTVTLTQPLFNWQNIQVYKEAGFKAVQAEATFGQATQDLIVRVAQAYFDVLASQDSLAFIQGQKVAISEQLAQAKRNFEVGTATITDTHEAQARFDLATTQEIAAQSDLEIKKRTLQQIVGRFTERLEPLKPNIELNPPKPNSMEDWATAAGNQGYPVRAQEAALVSSRSALDSNKLGYEVGVRINIYVLNAQQQVYSTLRDLSRARYDTILNGLRLKSASGTLGEADVEEVNRLLGTN